jgi:hypothetical protein
MNIPDKKIRYWKSNHYHSVKKDLAEHCGCTTATIHNVYKLKRGSVLIVRAIDEFFAKRIVRNKEVEP